MSCEKQFKKWVSKKTMEIFIVDKRTTYIYQKFCFYRSNLMGYIYSLPYLHKSIRNVKKIPCIDAQMTLTLVLATGELALFFGYS